ncbi:PGPGW domain-containing protein [Frankia sp. Cppng1_Ct_nod]|uniref:PGPGW domain-containing protein n=1 Tax=Frankia sp. Cppng1_Ct_nod TaxID=2897162 RepID=UPI0010416905|nr:PGPGW domain-containing protein [Frankia sp. Cppng1_Ct_nod]
MLNRGARLVRRIMVTTVGMAVLGVGVALLALPGPGFLVIALGFFILSLEYAWARRQFEQARQKAADLADQAAAGVWSSAFTIMFGLGMIAMGVAWIIVDTLPFSSPWTGGSLILGGLVILATILFSLWQAKQARDAGRPTPAELLDLAADGTRPAGVVRDQRSDR